MRKILFICYLIFLPSHGMSQPQLPPVSSSSGVVMSPGTQQIYQEAQACQQNPLNYSFSFCDRMIKDWNNIVAVTNSMNEYQNSINEYQACSNYFAKFNLQAPDLLNPPPGQTYQSCLQMLYSR